MWRHCGYGTCVTSVSFATSSLHYLRVADMMESFSGDGREDPSWKLLPGFRASPSRSFCSPTDRERYLSDLIQERQKLASFSQLMLQTSSPFSPTLIYMSLAVLLDPLSVPKKKGRLVGLGRRTRSVPPSSAPPPFVDPEVLTAQLKDKDDRISLLETQMAAQQAGYEAQRRLNQQMMEMMQRMYPNEVFPDVPDP
ncbi:hypothetical protein F2Q69_00000456 [Brassica cretica]|uniref:Uncharacterized protein n=1 Tax=Brassica cretica TaxID=69181 RepID=A0A8S9P4Z1_BRACR|nr:hypothetical protein F2Q69_00000456 [Brassica cretica]